MIQSFMQFPAPLCARAPTHTFTHCSPTTHTYNTTFLSSIRLIISNDPYSTRPTKRNAILHRKSQRLQQKTKASTLLCTFLFSLAKKKKRKGGREGRKKKSGQQQLNSYISGFVEAEEVCSWGGSGGRGGRPLFFSQTTKTPHPLKHFEFFFFFFFASLQPEDADQDQVIIL